MTTAQSTLQYNANVFENLIKSSISDKFSKKHMAKMAAVGISIENFANTRGAYFKNYSTSLRKLQENWRNLEFRSKVFRKLRIDAVWKTNICDHFWDIFTNRSEGVQKAELFFRIMQPHATKLCYLMWVIHIARCDCSSTSRHIFLVGYLRVYSEIFSKINLNTIN